MRAVFSPQRRWQAVAVLAVLNVLALLFVLLPARDERASLEDRQLDLQRRLRVIQREDNSGQGVAAILRQIDEYGEGFPTRNQAVDLRADLTRLARKLSLDVPSVSYNPTEMKPAGLTKITVSFGVEGPYPNIRRFLYELEGMRRHLVIERVALRDPRNNTADLQLQLQLAMYQQAD